MSAHPARRGRLLPSFARLALLAAAGCSPASGHGHLGPGGDPGGDPGAGDAPDLGPASGGRSVDLGGGGGAGGCGEVSGCYTVYAHSDHVLYRIDLTNKMLITVGPFNAPRNDVMTDLAVAPDDTIYTISHTTLYTASPATGQVTVVGSLSTCGSESVALTFTPDGALYAADYQGAFCRIDPKARPIAVTRLGALGGGYAIAGDLVAVGDGTMYGTAYQPKVAATAQNNLLVRIDPATGMQTRVLGPTSFPKLFGVAFENGQVFGFTHDGSGRVVTIDPASGKGTLYNTFTDPTTGQGISFAGAGVNALVMPPNPG